MRPFKHKFSQSKSNDHRLLRPLPRHAAFAAVFVTAIVWVGASLSADNGQPVTRIEEDWKIQFGVPDPDLDAPQVTLTISPAGSLDGPHAVFEVNHRTQPEYTAGGLQLQTWVGDSVLDCKSSHKTNVLSVTNDVATFTLSMQAQSGSVTFGVSNGNSTTWGQFGTSGWLSLSAPYSASDFSSYDSTTSLNNAYSYVGFGSNRVLQVVRTAVRYYSNGVLVNNDTTQHVIYQYTDGN